MKLPRLLSFWRQEKKQRTSFLISDTLYDTYTRNTDARCTRRTRRWA